jgi:hypothetical protein
MILVKILELEVLKIWGVKLVLFPISVLRRR